MNSAAQAELLIVNYHYCQPMENGFFSGVKGVRPDVFDRQLGTFQHRFRPIGASMLGRTDRAVASLDATGRPAVLVTFDDGTRDVFEHALPMLSARGMTAVLFCCSRPLLEGRVLNVQKIHLLQARLGMNAFRARFHAALDSLAPGVSMDDPVRLGLAHMYRYDAEETRRFKFLLNVRIPYDCLDRVLDALFEVEFGDQREAVRHIYMTAEELLRARDDGFAIGLHTHSHYMLSRLNRSEQEAEIGQCAAFFDDLLGERPTLLSYPYGIAGTYTSTTKDVLRDWRIEQAFTLGRRPYRPSAEQDPYEVPRFDVNDIFDTRQPAFADNEG